MRLEKYTAKTSVTMIRQQVKSHLLRLSYDMAFSRFAQFTHVMCKAKAKLRKYFKPHQNACPEKNFEGK